MRSHDDLEGEEIFARTIDLFLMATEAPDDPDHVGNLLDWLSASPRHVAALDELGRLLEMTRETLASIRVRSDTTQRMLDLTSCPPGQHGYSRN